MSLERIRALAYWKPGDDLVALRTRLACIGSAAIELSVGPRELVTQWRSMVALANAETPIPGDETGHIARWTAVEMCADELKRVLGEDETT